VGGKKAELWERIEAETERVSDRCPVSVGAKERAIQLQVMWWFLYAGGGGGGHLGWGFALSSFLVS